MSQKANALKDVIEYLHLWYDTYHKIILYIGSVAVSILFFTATFLIKEILSAKLVARLDPGDLLSLKRSLGLFAFSLLFVFINLLTTYNWFVSGVERAINRSGVDTSILGETFTYRRWMGGMWLWGRVSLVSGWLAGLCLFTGVVFYVSAILGILDLLLARTSGQPPGS